MPQVFCVKNVINTVSLPVTLTVPSLSGVHIFVSVTNAFKTNADCGVIVSLFYKQNYDALAKNTKKMFLVLVYVI
jgi:hypothetical protein